MRSSGLSKLLLFVALVVVPILTERGYARRVFKFTKTEPRIILGRYNQKVQIDCTTTDPTATTALYHRKRSNTKNNPKKPVTYASCNGSVYTVRNLGSDDTGFYSCEATNPGGAKIEWNKYSGRLFVIGLPDRHRTKKVNVGGKVCIRCSGPRGTVFKWHNKPSGARETSATRRGWTKSMLRLKNVQQRYNKRTITCLATFRGVTRRHVYKLIVNNPIPCEPVLNRNVRTIFHPKPKQKVEMTCEVERCMYPQPTFKWEMQWWPCSISNIDPDCLPRSGRWETSVTGRIKTSGNKSTLSVYDYMQVGFFRCTAKNFMGENSIVYRLIGRQLPVHQQN